jgi:hypothetical protein
MGTAIDELRQTLRVESDDEVSTVCDGGHPRPAREGPPLSEEGDVASDVGFVIRDAVVRKPILGLFTIGSSRSGVDSQWCHSRLRGLIMWVARRVCEQVRQRGNIEITGRCGHR